MSYPYIIKGLFWLKNCKFGDFKSKTPIINKISNYFVILFIKKKSYLQNHKFISIASCHLYNQ